MLNTNPQKLEPRSKVSLFVGYPKETRGGYFDRPKENKVFVSTNVTFLEEDHMRDHKPHSKIVLNEMTSSTTTNTLTRVVDDTSEIQVHHSQELGMLRRSGRVIKQPTRYMGLTKAQVVILNDDAEDPLTFKQAMDDVDKDESVKAMNLEME